LLPGRKAYPRAKAQIIVEPERPKAKSLGVPRSEDLIC
jgi:hypothetical protein